jgi:phosphatidylserine decarboxylase
MVSTPVVKEGMPYIIALAIVTAVVAYFHLLWSLVPGALLLFVTFFFRNPCRCIPAESGIIVSPADGRVMSVTEVYEDQFIKGPARKVNIFLSVFDVHINRIPICGTIKYQQYIKGRFLPAWREEVSAENERHTLGIENDSMKVLVTQIAGIIARRIISWVTVGDELCQGERYGLIKFGSSTEVTVPMNVEILVKKGDRVKGGETIIGRLKHD